MTPDQIAELRRRRYNATVIYLRKPNPGLMVFRVQPDFPVPEHQPGQYGSLGLGLWEPRFPGSQPEDLREADEARIVLRAYSLSHPILLADRLAPPQSEWLEFYVVLLQQAPEGNRPPGLTPRLFMLREGERLKLGERITGTFTLEGVADTDTVIFLSTGTGEAPHNYMLWELLRRGHRGRILSACCVRLQRDLGYLETHQRLMSLYPNYTYLSLTTREPGTAGRKVYLQDLVASGQLEQTLGQALDPASTQVFLCGNPAMIGAPEIAAGERAYPQPPGVIEVLERRGFRCDHGQQRGNVHFEKFW
jgi:ferredoxin--NADP+ reductase